MCIQVRWQLNWLGGTYYVNGLRWLGLGGELYVMCLFLKCMFMCLCVSGSNACVFNDHHQLFTVGTEDVSHPACLFFVVLEEMRPY